MICVIMSYSYSNLLCIIDTLYKKVMVLNNLLWTNEQQILKLNDEIYEIKEQNKKLSDYIKHQDNEIIELNKIIDTLENTTQYFKLLEDKDELEKTLMQQTIEYNYLISLYCDNEITL